MPTTTKTVASAFSFTALAACVLVGTSCVGNYPAKLNLVDQVALKKSTADIVKRSKTLGADFETRSEGLANAAASEEVIAVEVKFFQYPEGAAGSEHPPIGKPKTLSKAAAGARIKDLIDDRRVTTVSYPRVLTRSGRTVSIQSVVNQPFIAEQDRKNHKATIGALPIGSEIAVCPTLLKDGSIDVSTAIQITTITGSALVDGNKHPVPSSHYYQAPSVLRAGETLFFTAEQTDGEGDNEHIDIAITATKE